MRLFYWSMCVLTALSLMVIIVSFPSSVLAAGKCAFGEIEVGIPGIPKGQDICDFVNQGNPFVRYMGIIVNLLIGMIILIGFMVIVVGGYFYMTAGGDSSRISFAKTLIVSALLGIFLALVAYIILYTINPELIPTQDPPLFIPPPRR